MRRNYVPYVYVVCNTCDERWWYNAYSSGDDGKECCRNDPSHKIHKVDALGNSVNAARPTKPLKVSPNREQGPHRLWKPRRPKSNNSVSQPKSGLVQPKATTGRRPGYNKVTSHTGRTKKKREPIGNKLRFEVFRKSGFRCFYCGRSPREDKIKLEIDHFTPVSKGGTDDLENLVAACQKCNSGKSNTELTE